MTPMKFRCILEGVGAALMLLFYYRGLMEPSNLALFYHGLPVGHLVGGYLVDVLASAVLVALLLFSLEYLPPMPRRAALALFAGLMLWRTLQLQFKPVTG
jgi:glycerol uptake facilitator-like aquaporin